MDKKERERCDWPDNELAIAYHDTEWGVPCHDDDKLFEFIVLDTFQAGLSWNLMLQKREGMRKAFLGFDPKRLSKLTDQDVEELLKDKRIIRNGQKVRALIKNAKALLKIQKEFGSFDTYIWGFTDGKTIDGKIKSKADYTTRSVEAEAMSKDMKARGFSFVGPTTCYAFMQGIGMVNDHMATCFRYKQLASLPAKGRS